MAKLEPSVTIITVVFNGEEYLEKTILSVINQNYTNFEYIIIDGGSTDTTIELIKKYETKIDYWISEPDKGIYDAMNKGIKLAKGDWLNFMNAGDVFTNSIVLKNIFKQPIPQNIDFLYSDWHFSDSNGLISQIYEASYEKGDILHQSVIYKRNLHKEHGNYIVTSKIIVSDYIFFNSIPKERVLKVSHPISINDSQGVSSDYWSLEQKIAIDFVFHRITFKKMFLFYLKYILIRLKKGKWILK